VRPGQPPIARLGWPGLTGGRKKEKNEE